MTVNAGSLRVFYLANPRVTESLFQDLRRAGAKAPSPEHPLRLTLPNALVRRFMVREHMDLPEEHWNGSQVWFFEHVEEAARILSEQDADLLIVDERSEVRKGTVGGPQESPSVPRSGESPTYEKFQGALGLHAAPGFHFSSRRVLVVIPYGAETSDRTFVLGMANVRRVIVEPRSSVELFHFGTHQLAEFRVARTKTSLCLSGGGMEGYLYALGVAWALEDFFVEKNINDFDIFCGVSSGSIMALSYAAGITTQNLVDQVQRKKGILDHLTPGVLFDFASGEMVKRMLDLIKSVSTFQVSEILLKLQKVVPVGFFRGERLKEFVEEQLSRVGADDKLSSLKKELYVSVTDQDTGEHVVFGEEPWRDMKASQAVRASTALPPFYLPENVKGHWFTDGQLTSSSDFLTAIRKGARLVVLIDPMVPYTSQEPGSVLKHGGYFTAIQAIKSLVHTRAESFMRHAMDVHPDVDFVVFRPTDEVMAAMAGSPMKFRIRSELMELGRRVTLRQLVENYDLLSRRFAKHGMKCNSADHMQRLLLQEFPESNR
jgi:predicted acylesterase/phospholipase RssA